MPDGRDILFDSATPTFRVDGEEKPALARDLRLLAVAELLEGLASLQLSLAAIGPRQGQLAESLLYLDGAVLDFGKEVEVLVGPSSAQASVFKGRVSAIELRMDQGREASVRFLAEDRLMDLRMTRRFATYENADLADLAQRIASRHGLSARVEADSPRQAMVQQWNQTDLAFLREQAAQVAAELWIDGTVLRIADRGRRRAGASPITLIQGNDLLTIELRADLAEQRNRLTVGGYDAQAKDGIAEDAAGDLAAAEAEGRRTGPQILQAAFAERSSFRLRDVPVTGAEARAWSRAAMLARVRRFVRAEGVTMGTPKLRPGAQLSLERVGAPFEGGGYHVTRSLHRYDLEHGYRTLFSAERAGLGTGT